MKFGEYRRMLNIPLLDAVLFGSFGISFFTFSTVVFTRVGCSSGALLQRGTDKPATTAALKRVVLFIVLVVLGSPIV